MCDDRVLEALNARHFNPIRVPREGFDPLGVLGGTRTDLTYLGSLDELVDSPAPPPTIRRDDQAAAFSEQRTNMLDAKVGLDLLGRLFKALGGTVGLSAAANRAGGYEVVLLNVWQDWVSTLGLNGYLGGDVKLKPGMGDVISRYESIYLVTDTLKSNEFGIIAYDGSGAGIALKADALQDIVNLSAGLQVSKASGEVVCYKGDRQLRFAFRAVPLRVLPDGQRIGVGVDQGRLMSRAFGDDDLPLEAYPVLAPRELLDIKAKPIDAA